MDDYPRVLIVNSEPINSLSATGLTLKSLFGNWPPECLAQVYTSSMRCDVACSFTSHVTLMDLKLPLGLKRWLLKLRNIPIEQNYEQKTTTAINTHKSIGVLIPNMPSYLRNDIYSLLHLAPFNLPKSLLDACDEFRPDVIYSMLGQINIMKLVLNLYCHLKVPIIPHFMDDWASTFNRRLPFAFILLPMQTLLLRTIINLSPLGLSICDSMTHEYETRYNKRFYAFMNCVSDEDITKHNAASTYCNKIKLVYAGGLHFNRWKAITEIADAINIISRELPEPIEIDLYTHNRDFIEHKGMLSTYPLINCLGTVPNKEISKIYLEADILIHVESFDKTDRKFTRYSISSKIPEYMISGRPIFAYGPEEAASIRYIRDTGCGITVGINNKAILADALRNLLSSRDLWKCLGNKARDIAIERHSASRQRENFKKVLVQSSKRFFDDD